MSARMGISGSVAGSLASLGFAIVHGYMISEIWFSLPLLLAAGALCGFCLGATYGMLCNPSSLRSWVGFNALFVGFFVFIAVLSELVYEPVVALSVILAEGPPGYLWGQAVPLVVACTLLMAGLLYRIYGRTWEHFVAILGTSTVLVALLGLNISLMGLVFVPVESYYLIAETFGLILALNLVFTASFAILEWKLLMARSRSILPTTRLSMPIVLEEDKLQ